MVEFIMAPKLETTQMLIHCIFTQWKWITVTGNVGESYKHHVEQKKQDTIEYRLFPFM